METHPIPVTDVFRFGPFEVSLVSGELRKRGIRIALQEQPLRILSALLEAPGEIVSREALCRRLWPEGTFVDFEHSLNAAVRRLRVTLGDDAGVPRFIETVHKRGYRFLPMTELFPRPVRRLGPSAQAPAAAYLARGRVRLAVVPFGPHDAFSDGLTDEAIVQLALACPRHIGVIAKASMDSLRTVNADYVVAGSVRRDGDRVRISAHLIELQGDTHLWATSFDRVLTDTFTLQVEVGEAIARAVTLALAGVTGTAVGF